MFDERSDIELPDIAQDRSCLENVMTPYEDERSFLQRRALEERRCVAETSCIVRSVHEELMELYAERSRAACDLEATLYGLIERIV